jgi:ornithine cyclodeaminase/alanine dehydrogenase-like protein (mu-crystallin family)
VRFLDADATRLSLPMPDAIEAMRTAFDVDREVPLRQLLGSSFFMLGRVRGTTGVKVVSTLPGNPVGLVAVFDDMGTPLGIVDGPTLTAIRTGAVCGLATDLLAAPGASTMAMIGAGAMASDQISAVRSVRNIAKVIVWSRNTAKAKALAADVGANVALTVDDAVAEADIITTATPSTAPLFRAQTLRPTVHVNAIGAFTPEMVELPAGLLHDAFVVVDDYEVAKREAGDLLAADRTPDLDLTGLLSELPDHGPRTVFKSVGIASQDIAAAAAALNNANRLGLGTTI